MASPQLGLPDNKDKFKWNNEKIARDFNFCVKKHMLSLSISCTIKGVPMPQVSWYSGFRIKTNGSTLWITAGHVLEEIRKLQQSKDVGNIKANLHDYCNKTDAKSIPCDLSKIPLFPINFEGYDFGFAKLPEYYDRLIRAAEENQPLTESCWTFNDFEPEGYYIVGIPKEFAELEQVINDHKIYVETSSTLLSVPVIKEDPVEHLSESEFWRHDNNFYGKVLLPIHDDNGKELTDIRGMSGGPIFGVRVEKGEIQYRLIAIQSGWLNQSKFIKGTLFVNVMKIIDGAIEQAKKKKMDSC